MSKPKSAAILTFVEPVAKCGLPMLALSPRKSLTSHSDSDRMPARLHPVEAKEARHNFAVRALRKPGLLKPRPYVYVCVRCRETFLTDSRARFVIAIDREMKPLPEPENSARVARFASGPCPSLKGVVKSTPQKLAAVKSRQTGLSAAWSLRSAIASSFDRLLTTQADGLALPSAIAPQDLLF